MGFYPLMQRFDEFTAEPVFSVFLENSKSREFIGVFGSRDQVPPDCTDGLERGNKTEENMRRDILFTGNDKAH